MNKSNNNNNRKSEILTFFENFFKIQIKLD